MSVSSQRQLTSIALATKISQHYTVQSSDWDDMTGTTVASFQIDGKSPDSQMLFMSCKRASSEESGKCFKSW
ncbi:Hypothetical predicted protein [Mytilus galloprovincialis]|uniref:Uncharacterized protein n=1 Tax=Mytilus galloprovincialis TaxID=29158 RepID=A0A8B6EB11_MYTGA|nr:Hypothetical predicted protein [Mytilus galloprovincialis]